MRENDFGYDNFKLIIVQKLTAFLCPRFRDTSVDQQTGVPKNELTVLTSILLQLKLLNICFFYTVKPVFGATFK